METLDFGRFALSLLAVLALILLLAWLAVKCRLHQRFGAQAVGAPQLRVVERLMLDPRHRAVIVRRGEKEHLIVLGAQRPVLIESYDADHHATCPDNTSSEHSHA